MRLPLVTALIAGAVLGQVGASPLRVVIVSSTTEVSADSNRNVRFGLAVPHTNNSPVAMLANPAGPDGKKSRTCHARLRTKTTELSNAFRKLFGLPLIETSKRPSKVAASNTEGRYHILPFIGTPPAVVEYTGGSRPHHNHHHVGFRHKSAKVPFVDRLQVALTALGPWEGRAVAFVLGCGIGVLFRMLWVLAVIFYRMIKGKEGEKREEDNGYDIIITYEDEPGIAPPTYTYVDEKADKKADDEVQVADTPEQTK